MRVAPPPPAPYEAGIGLPKGATAATVRVLTTEAPSERRPKARVSVTVSAEA